MLRASAREFLAKQCPSSYVRHMMEVEDAWDPAFWARLAELGWTGVGIPEHYGGVGTFLDLVVVLEEAGGALLPGPFFSTMGMAVPTLLEAGSEAQKKEVLSAIAAGTARATVAVTEPSGRRDAQGGTLAAQPAGAGARRHGVNPLGPSPAVAAHRLVAAATAEAG